MPDQANLSKPSTLGTQSLADAVAGFDVGLVDAAGDYPESSIESVARRALEMTINVIEAQAGQRGRNTSTVNLKLRLAGEDIAIRVQLHKGEVRTSFHTESHELRAAISREWQIAASESTQRGLHFSEPEFTSTSRAFQDRGEFENAGRDGNSSREWAETRREAAAHRSFFGRPSAGSVKTDIAAPVIAPGSLHLSTFA